MIIGAHEKLQKNIFDISLFATIVFFIIREGFEIALFTATTSLFSVFIENAIGLLAGFATSAALGALTFVTYIKFPVGRVFKITEYMIVLLGAAFVMNGIGTLTEVYYNFQVANILPIHLTFLPAATTFPGHMIKNLFGLQQNFSLLMLAIMTSYIAVIYFTFLRRKKIVIAQ